MVDGELYGPIIIGLGLSLIGFGLVLVSNELEPGPLVGIRISYLTVSRKVWSKVNKVFGLILGFGALAVIPVGVLWGIGAELECYTVMIVIAVITVIEYSARLAEREMLSLPGSDHGEVVEPLNTKWKIILVTVALIDIIIYTIVAKEISSEGLGDVAFILIVILILALYLVYLSLARIEAYALPWLKERYREIAFFIPLSLLVLDASIGLIVLGWKVYGLIILILSILLTIYPIILSLHLYRTATRFTEKESNT